MSDCCSSDREFESEQKVQLCPNCGDENKKVSPKTILHQIRQPWAWKGNQETYFFCGNPDCDVVYSGHDSTIIKTSDLRTVVGIKVKNRDAPLCYCFGVSYGDAAENPNIKQFVIEKTKGNNCACETRNPSGQCCLKEFSKL